LLWSEDVSGGERPIKQLVTRHPAIDPTFAPT